MTKKKARRRKTDGTTRREFFQSAGRGTLVLGGVALVGTGASVSGCSDDDDSGSSGSGGNTYGGTGGAGVGGEIGAAP